MTATTQPDNSRGGLAASPCGALRRPQELAPNVDVSGLVDTDGGLVDRAVFTNEQIYRQELRRIFATSWLFLAHVDQFHKPGDFFTTYMGGNWSGRGGQPGLALGEHDEGVEEVPAVFGGGG
jgi:3-phenylpropionate/trans-cinnamate dioxygenase subunit alpha